MDYWVVDAFTREPFHGNPAAVVFLESDLSDAQRQAVAAEFNLSETAFVQRIGPGRWHLRWFTPTTEIDLCGHATLASAHAIWESGSDNNRALVFETLSGELRAERTEDMITLRFPSIAYESAELDAASLEALALQPVQVSRTHHDLLIEVAEAEQVRDYRPDPARVAGLPARGLIITARNNSIVGEPAIDFVSRFFAPAIGVAEDPVTGAIHCALGPYWAAKLGKTTLVAKQLSARSGVLHLTVSAHHVLLAGHAVGVMQGKLAL